MTPQETFDALTYHPVVVPTPDVDHGAEYQEGDPVFWDGREWEVLDWNFDRNSFVLVTPEEMDDIQRIERQTWRGEIPLRRQILDALWGEE